MNIPCLVSKYIAAPPATSGFVMRMNPSHLAMVRMPQASGVFGGPCTSDSAAARLGHLFFAHQSGSTQSFGRFGLLGPGLSSSSTVSSESVGGEGAATVDVSSLSFERK